MPTGYSRQQMPQRSFINGGSFHSGANSRHLSQVDLPRGYTLKHKRSSLWKISGGGCVDDEKVRTCPPVGVTRI